MTGPLDGYSVAPIPASEALRLVVANHYLHRRTSVSHSFGLFTANTELVGVVTFGTPASRYLQLSACPTDPGAVTELNRLWVDDAVPPNGESYFLARALRTLPPFIVVSYADTARGHAGYVYRAANFRYAGWTDMDRKTPRFDYVLADPSKHNRDAFRGGGKASADMARVRRQPKVRYWTVTGTRRDRSRLERMCGWPTMSWKATPPPAADAKRAELDNWTETKEN